MLSGQTEVVKRPNRTNSVSIRAGSLLARPSPCTRRTRPTAQSRRDRRFKKEKRHPLTPQNSVYTYLLNAETFQSRKESHVLRGTQSHRLLPAHSPKADRLLNCEGRMCSFCPQAPNFGWGCPLLSSQTQRGATATCSMGSVLNLSKGTSPLPGPELLTQLCLPTQPGGRPADGRLPPNVS